MCFACPMCALDLAGLSLRAFSCLSTHQLFRRSWLTCLACPVCALGLTGLSVRACSFSKSSCKHEFEAWKSKHQKSYGSAAEHKKRLDSFCTSMKEIAEINTRPGVTWRAATNPYSDLTWEEFHASKLMAAQNCSATHTTPVSELVTLGEVPLEWDWRNQTVRMTCFRFLDGQTSRNIRRSRF